MDKQKILSIIDDRIEAAKRSLRVDQDAGDNPNSYDVGNGYGKIEALKTLHSIISDFKEPSERVLLAEMDDIVRHINDEGAFAVWAENGVPDGAEGEELDDIASDKASMSEITNLFAALIVEYAHGPNAFAVGAVGYDGYTKKK